jgi:hypothetical protein
MAVMEKTVPFLFDLEPDERQELSIGHFILVTKTILCIFLGFTYKALDADVFVFAQFRRQAWIVEDLVQHVKAFPSDLQRITLVCQIMRMESP